MDDELLEEITGIKSINTLYQELLKEIYIAEINLYFNNYFELIEYLSQNIYRDKCFYVFNINYKTYNIKLYFRDKHVLLAYYQYKYNLEKIAHTYLDYLEYD
jgi:hypothetical protein